MVGHAGSRGELSFEGIKIAHPRARGLQGYKGYEGQGLGLGCRVEVSGSGLSVIGSG